MIDYTRQGHNEAVQVNGTYNEETKKVEECQEDVVVYVKERINDKVEKDDRWRMTIKAAAQKGKDVKIICRERSAISETKKIKQMEQQLLGKAKREKDLTDEQLIERMIVEFENNKISMRYASEELQEKYFTDLQREELLQRIENYIDVFKESDWDKYHQLVKKLASIYSNELGKTITNTEKVVNDNIANFEYYYAKFIELCDNFRDDEKRYKKDSIKTELGDFTRDTILKTINEINQLPFYDDNKIHSIEHIEKVILFAGILSQNQYGTDIQLLITAAAFHDSGRNGNDTNTDHAELSAKQIEKYFNENPENPFGITKENLGILQTAIHYHEYIEPKRGKVDLEKINELCKQYGVKKEDLESTIKICTLLKDADALDRARFARRGRLDKNYLRSDVAKSDKIIEYAIDINNKVARQILIDIYGMNVEELTDGKEVEILRNVRLNNKANKDYIEPHLPLSKRLQIFGITERPQDIAKKEKLLQIYKKFGIRQEEIEEKTDEILNQNPIEQKIGEEK
jgi:hypothetical protein